MILVIDVGNTNMTLGVYDGQELRATFRMMTKQPRTSDEYGVFITQLLKNKGIEALELEGAIVASVVPDVMHSLIGALVKYTHTRPINVGPGTKTGIRIVTEDPRQSVRTESWMLWQPMRSTAGRCSCSTSERQPPMT